LSPYVCPTCNANVSAYDRYCRLCGSRIVQCSSCNSIVHASSRFCHRCGSSLFLQVRPQVRPQVTARQLTRRQSHSGLIAAVFMIVVLLGSAILIIQLPRVTWHPPSVTEIRTPQIQQYVQIRVGVAQGDTKWSRNPLTDLPQCSVLVIYNVYNEGTASAQYTHIVILVDNNVANDYSASIASHERHSDSVTFTFVYDTTHEVSVDASCAGSSDHASLAINAYLPRSPTRDPDVAKLYITPNDPVVKSALSEISKLYAYRISKWMAIRDWVSTNIRYDGRGDYWQLPRETLERRTGVCKEYSILLVSLLRAAGYSEDRVFVVLGRKGESYHAWVRIRIDVIGWQNIEPQGPSLLIIIGDYLVLSGYSALYYFNDANYASLG